MIRFELDLDKKTIKTNQIIIKEFARYPNHEFQAKLPNLADVANDRTRRLVCTEWISVDKDETRIDPVGSAIIEE